MIPLSSEDRDCKVGHWQLARENAITLYANEKSFCVTPIYHLNKASAFVGKGKKTDRLYLPKSSRLI